jgi:hypothetical protein
MARNSSRYNEGGKSSGGSGGTVSAATTSAAGTVRLADAAAVTAGTAGRVVDAAQLKAAVPAGVSPAVANPLAHGTAAVGTSTKFAREDHVHPSDAPQPATVAPAAAGTAAVGTGTKYAREDHVHPAETGGAANVAPVAHGTAAVGASTRYARQDHVHPSDAPAAATVAPVMNGAAAVGTSAKFAREDHVHASDTSRIPLSTVTTKGDLMVGTGAGAVSRLGVGTDGQVPVADSASATGIKWATPAAGGSASGVVSQANGGIDVALGDLKFRLAASGNRSLQVSTASGTATLKIQNLWSGGASPATGLVTINATTTPAYINSTWNFTSAGVDQDVTILHVETGKIYRMRMEVGASYNNNTFAGIMV